MTTAQEQELDRARQGVGIGGDEVAPPIAGCRGDVSVAPAARQATDDETLAGALRLCHEVNPFARFEVVTFAGGQYPVAGVGLACADAGGTVRDALRAQGYTLEAGVADGCGRCGAPASDCDKLGDPCPDGGLVDCGGRVVRGAAGQGVL